MNISRTALSPQSQSLDFEGKGQTMKESVPSLCTLFPSICRNSAAFGERLSRQCPVLAENKELAMYICTRAKALLLLELPQNYGLFIICFEFLTALMLCKVHPQPHPSCKRNSYWNWKLVVPSGPRVKGAAWLHHHTTVPSFQLLDSHGFCR